MLLELHEKISYSEKGKELNMGGRRGEARKSSTQGQCWEVDTVVAPPQQVDGAGARGAGASVPLGS